MNRCRIVTALSCATLLMCLRPPLLSAQATTGEITGRIEDSGGAVVPGAMVVALNPDTGFSRSTISTGEGEYLITLLPPGRYTVSAELQGFKRAVRENVIVSVGTRQTLMLLLEVGGVTEQVLVSGSTPLIDTTRSEISGVVTARDIANLPALNRTFANLAMTMPEARPAGGFDPTKTRVGNFAMNGGDGRQLDVNVDGGDNKDNVVGSLLQNFAYESVQEFQVLQHRWSAEAGRAVGGVVNVISKSGTNEYRGSAFGTFRNDDMVARDFFQKTPGVVKPPFERKEYGGSVGGPILRDRLFFFGAIERFDEPKSETPIRSQAIFNELRAVPGANPVAAIPTPYDDTLLTAKVDQRLNDRQNLSYRFSMQQNSSDNDQVANPATTDLSGGSTNTNDLYDLVRS
jgi:CBS domain-containing protein